MCGTSRDRARNGVGDHGSYPHIGLEAIDRLPARLRVSSLRQSRATSSRTLSKLATTPSRRRVETHDMPAVLGLERGPWPNRPRQKRVAKDVAEGGRETCDRPRRRRATLLLQFIQLALRFDIFEALARRKPASLGGVR